MQCFEIRRLTQDFKIMRQKLFSVTMRQSCSTSLHVAMYRNRCKPGKVGGGSVVVGSGVDTSTGIVGGCEVTAEN